MSHDSKMHSWVPTVTLKSPQLMVVDNFLDEATFEKVYQHFGSVDYESVHMKGQQKVWRLNDGDPLRGRPVFWCADTIDVSAIKGKQLYPTNTDVDLFIEQLTSIVPTANSIIGTPGEAWSNVTVTPWIYPVGSALSLHRDGFDFTGAYTYFLHKRWNVHWGGYLLVFDENTKLPCSETSSLADSLLWIDESREEARILEPGLARCIFPKPNRLVLLGPNVQHLLSRVDTNAGAYSRISIAGFFRKSFR